jgi:hypothetical protein
MTMYYNVSTAGVPTILKSGTTKDLVDGEGDSMKQIIEYIRSYSKALLQKIGVQVAEHPRRKAVQRGGRPLRAERRR